VKGTFRVFRVEQVEMKNGTKGSQTGTTPPSANPASDCNKESRWYQHPGGFTRVGPCAGAREAWTSKGERR